MTGYKNIVFRVLLVYFLLQAFPLDWKYYRQVFTVDWTRLHYGAIFDLAHYAPRWSDGPQRYIDWFILLGIAVIGGILWKGLDRRRPEQADYDRWFYWVRTIVRYRLAIAMIAYGFIKLFPLQAPYPSISNLNTNYGDFTRWKLFSLSLGVVPSYESFLGGVEIVGGLLLFYRRSASIGAFILAVFLGNVFMSNLAYGGGDDVYSLYLISLVLFVLSYDAQRLANLLFFERTASPNTYHPVFPSGRQRYIRFGLKTVFILFFVIVYGFKTREGYRNDPYQFPTTKGLPGASGIYNVTQFVLGKDTLAYSRTDTLRWQDVVFENWATLSIRWNRAVVLDSNNVERMGHFGDARTYELEGAAGRHYYSYKVDTALHVLILRNKNPHNAGEGMVLHYERSGDGRIILSGAAVDNVHVYAVLDRIDKKYLLEEARKQGRQRGLAL